MQNAVIYARYSSHGQNEQTIEGQVRVCKEYAEKLKLKIVNIYIDKHKTGTDVNRPQFQKMISDSATGAFQYVIVYMIDRFARNRYYSTLYNFQLQQNDVKLVSATENISESEEGEFYQMFLEWNAERYSKRLSKRVTEGLTTSVNNGTYTGGRLIYGYKKDGNRVVIDEDAAEVVRYIFAEYAAGVSKTDIAAALNKKGLRHHGGKLYTAKSLDKMLINQKYTGTFYFGDRLATKTFPRIIEQSVFDAVQKRAQANKYFSGANSAKVTYLLQGKVYCGHCGSNMVGDGGTGKLGTRYYYYSCAAKKKRRAPCTKSREKKDFLEWYATEQTVNYLSDPRRVDIIASDVIKYYESRTSTTEIKRITAERSKIQKDIDNAVNLMISGVDSATVRVLDIKIKELSALLDDLSQHQARLELEAGLRVTKADIIAFVGEFIKGNLHDKEFQKRIIDNLVNAMYIYDDKVVLYFNINSGRETAFIGKDETDAALSEVFNPVQNKGNCGGGVGVQTLTPSPRQPSPDFRGFFRQIRRIAMDEQKEKKQDASDDILEYPDFSKLDCSNFRKLPKHTILGISKAHFWIYLGALGISILLIVPYAFFCQGTWQNICMSIGASGIGAAFLGYFIELAVKSAERKRIVLSYNESILLIYHYSWEIFANRSYDYMRLISPTNAQTLLAKQSADKFITQINAVIPQIDSLFLKYGELPNEDTTNFYMELRHQLIQFKASLQTPIDTDNLITLLNSVRNDLRKRFELPTIEKQLLRP